MAVLGPEIFKKAQKKGLGEPSLRIIHYLCTCHLDPLRILESKE